MSGGGLASHIWAEFLDAADGTGGVLREKKASNLDEARREYPQRSAETEYQAETLFSIR